MRWAFQHWHLGPVTANAGEGRSASDARTASSANMPGNSGNLTCSCCRTTLPLLALYYLAQWCHKTKECNSEDSWQGGKNDCLREVFRQANSSAGLHISLGTPWSHHHNPAQSTVHSIFRELEAGAVSWRAALGRWTPLTGLLLNPWGSEWWFCWVGHAVSEWWWWGPSSLMLD